MKRFSVTWHGNGRKATQPPDPHYPNGIALDLARGQKHCAADLPYPAVGCGHWLVRCEVCGFSTVITAAGRADDPYLVRVPCRPVVN